MRYLIPFLLAGCAGPGPETATDSDTGSGGTTEAWDRPEATLELSTSGSDVYVTATTAAPWSGTLLAVATTDAGAVPVVVDLDGGIGLAAIGLDPCTDPGHVVIEAPNATGDAIDLVLDLVDIGAPVAVATGEPPLVICGAPTGYTTEYEPDPTIVLSVSVSADWQLARYGDAGLVVGQGTSAFSGDGLHHLEAGQWTVTAVQVTGPYAFTTWRP